MKKTLFFSLLVFFCLSGFAQETKRKFRFGLKAAPVAAWIKPDYRSLPNGYSVDGGGVRLGFVWGPMAEFIINETFSFATGADISYTSGRLTGKINTPELAEEWEQLYKMRFVDIPLTLKFRTKEIGYLRYFGLFGMGVGIRTSAKTEFSRIFPDKKEEITPDDDTDKYVNLFRGSLLVGGGVEYNFSGNTSLVGSIVFNNGLTNLIKDQGFLKQDSDVNLNEKGVNNYFMLNIGILF